MTKIIRLTESDLTRIVNRVINEAARNVGKTFTVDGDTYQATIGAGDKIFYWGSKSQSKPSATTIEKLNRMSGYNIPTSNGETSILYIKKNPGFKTTLRNLI
jgi:hypothetical protein